MCNLSTAICGFTLKRSHIFFLLKTIISQATELAKRSSYRIRVTELLPLYDGRLRRGLCGAVSKASCHHQIHLPEDLRWNSLAQIQYNEGVRLNLRDVVDDHGIPNKALWLTCLVSGRWDCRTRTR